MSRVWISFAVVLLGIGSAASAAPTPGPTHAPRALKTPSFSNKIRLPKGPSTTVSAAACNRRTVGVDSPQGTMGPNGATKSQTIVAVPLGGRSAASATTQQQITEACNHQRR